MDVWFVPDFLCLSTIPFSYPSNYHIVTLKRVYYNRLYTHILTGWKNIFGFIRYAYAALKSTFNNNEKK